MNGSVDGAAERPEWIRLGVFVGLTLLGIVWDLLSRSVMPSLGKSIGPGELAAWLRGAAFGINLATLAGAIALVVAVSRLIRRRDLVPYAGAFGMAVFGAVFLVSLYRGLAADAVNEAQVMYGYAGGYMLLSLLCVTGIRARSGALQLAFGLWASMVFTSLGVIVFERVRMMALAAPLRTYDEVVWFAIPIAAGAHFGAFTRGARLRALLAAARHVLHARGLAVAPRRGGLPARALQHLLRLGAGPGASGRYALLFALVVGVGIACATARDERDRWGGFAILLMVFAGHLPRSLGLLTVHLLACALLVTAARGSLGRRPPARGPAPSESAPSPSSRAD